MKKDKVDYNIEQEENEETGRVIDLTGWDESCPNRYTNCALSCEGCYKEF